MLYCYCWCLLIAYDVIGGVCIDVNIGEYVLSLMLPVLLMMLLSILMISLVSLVMFFLLLLEVVCCHGCV